MDSLEDKVAIVTGGRSGIGAVVARLNKKKIIGLLLCLAAVVGRAAGWAWASSGGETSTDNAYVRADVTSLAPKVAGYVTAVEVEDNQTVRAGHVLFRIDDRDYRARLAQAVANVEAAQARLTNVDAEITTSACAGSAGRSPETFDRGRVESRDQGLRPPPRTYPQ